MEENKPEAPRNSINKQRFLFSVVLKRARALGSRRRREDWPVFLPNVELNLSCR